VTLENREPEVGMALEISGRRWTVTDHSTYQNDEGFEVVEWEVERADGNETAYLLRESDESVRWFFTRPIPISAITLSGGKPFAGVAASATEPPDALTFRGRAYGFDEKTEGTYEEEPGEAVPKTTWDYWDAAHQANLAVERWADGRVDCYHGNAIQPSAIRVLGSGAVSALRDNLTKGWKLAEGSNVRLPHAVSALIPAGVLFFIVMIVTSAVETGLTVGLGVFVLVAVVAAAWSSGPLLFWAPISAIALAALFHRFPPLTNIAGVALLLAVPAGLAALAARRDVKTGPVLSATAAAVGGATFFAGLIRYYQFAPSPRTFGQYLLAIGPVPLTMIVAAVAGYAAIRLSGTR
jgi:hypothetical protein